MSLVLKTVGWVITAVAALVALFGHSHEGGRLTRIGWASLACILVGVALNIWIALHEQRLAKEQAEIAAVAERVQRDWETVLDEPLRDVELSIYANGSQVLPTFLDTAQTIGVTLRDQRGGGSVSLEFRAEPVESDTAVRLRAKKGDGVLSASADRALVCQLEEKNGFLRGVSDLAMRVLPPEARVCGFTAELPWSALGLTNIATLRDLFYLKLKLSQPTAPTEPFFVLGDYKPGLRYEVTVSSHSGQYTVGNYMLRFATIVDDKDRPIGEMAEVNGHDLLAGFAKQYKARRAITDAEQVTKFGTMSGKVMSLKHVIHFGRIDDL